MVFKELKQDELNEQSLDDFRRFQQMKDVYRETDGNWEIVAENWVMDWDLEKKKMVILELKKPDNILAGFLEDEKIVAFISLKSKEERLLLDMIQVSCDFRGLGLGKKMFSFAIERAKMLQKKQIYISACPAVESIRFYKAMGCRVAEEPIPEYKEKHPMDMQLVYEQL